MENQIVVGAWGLTCHLGGSRVSAGNAGGNLVCEGANLTSGPLAPIANFICQAWTQNNGMLSYAYGQTVCAIPTIPIGATGS